MPAECGKAVRRSLRVAGLAALIFAPCVCPAPVAQSGNADVRVLRKIAVRPVADLSFGQITIAAGLGTFTITVTADGRVTTSGTTAVVIGAHRGEVAALGEPGFAYTVQAPTSVALTTNARPLMAQDFRFKSLATGTVGGNGYSAAFPVSGEDRLYIGGSLVIPSTTLALVLAAGTPLHVNVPVSIHYQ